MAQFLRPASDLSINGWTGSSGGDLYQFIDESSASDVDYIQWIIDNSGGIADNNAEFTMSSISDPQAGAGTLRVRAFLDTMEALVEDPTIEVALKEGGTTFYSSSQVVTTTVTTYSFAVSSALMAAVTDWSDISLNVTVTDGDDTRVMKVTWAELETPDATAGSGGFTSSPSLIEATGKPYDSPNPKGNGKSSDILLFIGGTDSDYERMWRSQYKPRTVESAKQKKVCTACGMYCAGEFVQYFRDKPFCPDHAPRETNRGPNAVRI